MIMITTMISVIILPIKPRMARILALRNESSFSKECSSNFKALLIIPKATIENTNPTKGIQHNTSPRILYTKALVALGDAIPVVVLSSLAGTLLAAEVKHPQWMHITALSLISLPQLEQNMIALT
jgi:hypothetical protein